MLYNVPIRQVRYMKIEKIHVNKIKVTFTPDDVIEHNLTAAAVKENAPRIQQILMSVVRRAEEEVGFSAENARLMVEAMPAEDHSLVMYITRLGENEEIKDALTEAKKRFRLKVRQAPLEEAGLALISFESFEDAIRLSRFAEDFDGGELYYYNERYHLLTESDHARRFSEFGIKTTDRGVCDIVCEHGKLICKNALKTLRESF